MTTPDILPGLPPHYEHLAVIGSGGFGVVHRLRNHKLDVDVVIKVVASHRAAKPAATDRFLREARALRQADHVHLVPVDDVGRLADGRPYLIMAYADRGTLLGRIGRPTDPQSLRRLLHQLRDAVVAVRDLGLVHRDIKPDNILIHSTTREPVETERAADNGPEAEETGGGQLLSDDEALWLADLGLVVDEGQPISQVAGTRRYVAPEQAHDGASLDHRTDVYATALTLAEILAGRHLQVEDLTDCAELSVETRTALVRATHPSIARRTPTVEALVAEIEEAELGTTTLAVGGPGATRSPRRRLAIAAAATLAVAGTAGGGLLVRQFGADEVVSAGSADDLGSELETEAPDGPASQAVPPIVVPVGEPITRGVEALLTNPHDGVVDPEGNLYFTDTSAHTVWRLSPDGAVARVAGGNGPGHTGDGGPALQAQLRGPEGLAPDGSGGLYIAERSNRLVRHIAADGTITTVVGDPSEPLFSGPVAVAATPDAALLIVDHDDNRIWTLRDEGSLQAFAGTGVAGYSGDGEAAIDAQLAGPTDLIVEADGSVVISDYWNHRIRRIAPDGTISTIAGNGTAQRTTTASGNATSVPLGLPASLTSDGDDIIVVSDADRAIRRLSADGQISETLQGRDNAGPTPDRLVQPSDVVIGTDGEWLVLDSSGNRVHRLDSDGVLDTVAGRGPAGPRGDNRTGTEVALDFPIRGEVNPATGDLVVIQRFSEVIRSIDSDGTATTLIGGGRGRTEDGELAAVSRFDNASDVAFLPDGRLLIAEWAGSRVRIVETIAGLEVIGTFAGTGAPGSEGIGGTARLAQIDRPTAVVADNSGNVYIAEQGNERVSVVDAATGTLEVLSSAEDLPLGWLPWSLVVDGDTLYVADAANARIVPVDLSTGTVDVERAVVTGPTYGPPTDLALRKSGELVVTTRSNQVLSIDVSDSSTSVIAGTGSAGFGGDGEASLAAEFDRPLGLTIGLDDEIYVIDYNNHRIRVIDDGAVDTFVGGWLPAQQGRRP